MDIWRGGSGIRIFTQVRELTRVTRRSCPANNITTDSGLYHSTKVDCADTLGGANATTVTFAASDGQLTLSASIPALEIGRSGFIEFDMKAAAASALTEIMVQTHPGLDFGQSSLQRVLKVPASWTRVRLPFTTRSTGNLILRFSPYGFAAGKTSVIIGRPAIYYAQEPVNQGVSPAGIGLPVVTAAPANPYLGMMIIADRATWDPKGKGSGGPYPVWYNGSAWKLLNEQ